MEIITFLIILFFVFIIMTFVMFSIFYGIPNFHTIGSMNTKGMEQRYIKWKRDNKMDV
jgi:hypothetical protein